MMIQMIDRVWAEEAGVEVSVQYQDNGGTVKVEIIKDSVVVAAATLGVWRWDRLHKIEVKP